MVPAPPPPASTVPARRFEWVYHVSPEGAVIVQGASRSMPASVLFA